MVHRWKEHPVREFLSGADRIIDAKPQPLVQVPGVRKEDEGRAQGNECGEPKGRYRAR